MSATPDRDRLIEQALARALPRDAGAGEACLDAETLAAWVDHGLSGAAAVEAEAHVSSCARCQALVATLTRTLPAEVDAAPARPSLWRWWFGPLAAAAAATTIWMVMPASTPAPPVAESVVADAPFAAPESTPAPDTSMKADTASPESAAGEAMVPSPAPAAPLDERRAAAQATSPETPAEEPPVATAERPAAQAERGVALRDRAEVASALAAAPPAVDTAAPPVEVIAPVADVRWRVVNGRSVERSSDAGRTWVPQMEPLDGIATAGAAPTTEVCWLVGPDGAVWLAAGDGPFTRVVSPAVVDLVAVSAESARDATVTAADGRRFLTRDGGTTWALVR
ncbi:MAG: zf-HC2 domain-containing protein [Vicinamibacteria bacterium]